MQGGGFHPWNPPDFTLKSGGFHLWNLVDFTQISPVKSTQSYKSKCFSKNSSVWWMQGGGYDQGFHEIQQSSPMKSGRFHPDFTCEIHPNYKSKCFSKNSSVWWMQGGGYDQGFDLWNPAEFTLKSGRFDLWNPVDFTQISPVKSTQNYKSKCFSKNSSVWWMQGGGCDQGFHEICQISHEIHMKSTRFHEIHWISKLWAFAWWSSVGLSFFKRPIRRVFAETSDFIRFGVDFTWNPPDFIRISWNPADFMWNRKTFARNCNSMFTAVRRLIININKSISKENIVNLRYFIENALRLETVQHKSLSCVCWLRGTVSWCRFGPESH